MDEVNSNSQSAASKPATTKLVIAIALVISVLEAVLSTMNAVQDDAFRLASFEEYVYSASSIMELVGLLFGLACCFLHGWDIQYLGLPLTLVSTGVVDDDLNGRMIGFKGTVLQAGFVSLLLVVWLCLTVDWFFWVVVATTTPVLLVCLPIVCIVKLNQRSSLVPPALTRREREISAWMYVTLPFSPVVVEVLESYFLLKDFSFDTLVLLVVDVLAVLPGILWLVMQVLNAFKPRANSTQHFENTRRPVPPPQIRPPSFS